MLFGVGLLRSLEPVGTVASPLSLSVLGLGYFPTNRSVRVCRTFSFPTCGM